MRWALESSHARRPEELLRSGPVEPWDVDANMQPAILAWMGSSARWAVVAAHGSYILQLLSGLGDELLSIGLSLPGVLLRDMCREACLHVVPEHLSRDAG